jgi:hypothetical protein
MFHKSTSPVVTVHNIKIHTAGRKAMALNHPLLWPHKQHSLCDDVSFLYPYTILRDMQQLDRKYSKCVAHRRHHKFRYSPRNRSVDIYVTRRYNMQHRGREGQPLTQQTELNYLSLFVCFWRDSLQWGTASLFTRFIDHT